MNAHAPALEPLLAELRALEAHVEKTLGQAAPAKTDITSNGKQINGLGLSEWSDAELDDFIARGEGGEG